MIARFSVVVAALAAVGSIARADEHKLKRRDMIASPPGYREHLAKNHAHDAEKTALTGITFFLNNCASGCTVRPGNDDATTDTSILASSVVQPTPYSFQPGEWEALVACVKEVYSPFNVNVVDTRPSNSGYTELIVAGTYEQVTGMQNEPGSVICGTASSLGGYGCTPLSGQVSFAYTDSRCFGSDPDPVGNTHVRDLCWTAVQETAHTLGLDHAFGHFEDGRSTCNDPMTYAVDCGGVKFFRNFFAPCNGNDGQEKPMCGAQMECATQQNSHLKMTEAVGASTNPPVPVKAQLIAPAAGTVVKVGTSVFGKSQSDRGVESVQLLINGYPWASQLGAVFGANGQPDVPYTFTIPDGLPDSKLDIQIRGIDDLGTIGDSEVVSMVKGKATGCDPSVVNADGTFDTCLAGQQCTDGKCAWTDANTGNFGDACTYQQFCTGTLQCAGTETEKICTHSCDTGIADSCPMGFSCAGTGTGSSGVCFLPADSGGCCSVGANGLPATMMSLATLAIVLRRRKRS